MQSIFLSKDPDYLSCKKKECKKYRKGKCVVKTCSASVTFHVINIRTDIEFVLFANDFDTPCILARTSPLSFLNPNKALYGHLSSIDSSGTSVSFINIIIHIIISNLRYNVTPGLEPK